MIVDNKFVEENINEFIKTYFEFNNDNRARKKQFRDRWLNTIAPKERESQTKDKVKISNNTILYIQEIIKLRREKAEGRKLVKNTEIKNLEHRIASLEKQIKQTETICETWRKITQVLSKNLKDKNPKEYYELIDELGVNKAYYGL